MPIVLNGSGTISGVSVGGLPDGIVDTDMIANSNVTARKMASGVGGKIVQVKSVSKLDTFSVASPTALQFYDVTGLDNLQITTTGSNKVLVFMTVHISMPASGYRVFMKGIRTTSGSVTNLSYPSSSSNNIEASSTVVSASNTPHGRVPYPLHIVGFEDSPGAGTHQYGIQIGTVNLNKHLAYYNYCYIFILYEY